MPLRKPYMWLVGGSVTVGVFIIAGLLALIISVHHQFPKATDSDAIERVHPDQCEKLHSDSAVAERQNTWSNLAYLLAGVLVLARARSVQGRLFGAHLCVLALWSGLYHATLKGGPQVMDVAMVYAALFSLIVYGVRTIGRVHGWNIPWCCLLISTLALDLFSFQIKKIFEWKSEIVFGVLTALLLATIIWSWARARPAKVGGSEGWVVLTLELLGMLLVSGLGTFVFQLGDGYTRTSPTSVERDWLCSPNAFIQAHAVWHVLSATALLLTYDVLAQLGKEIPGPADEPTVYPA